MNRTTAEPTRLRSSRISPWAWLLAGCAAAVFAAGSRWDIPLAAWLLPICLLRFSRASSPALALLGVLAVCLVQIGIYLVASAVPFNAMTIALGLTVGTVYAAPFALDRTLGARLSGAARILLFPVAAVAGEFAIGAVLPLGTAVGMRAITQGEELALLQVISVAGPYAVAFLIGCAATIANRLLEEPDSRSARRWGVAFLTTLAVIVAAGQARLAFNPPSTNTSTVKIAAITPDRDLRIAASDLLSGESLPASAEAVARVSTPEMRARYVLIADQLLDDTRRAARAGAKIVAWSETAAPSTQADKGALLARVAQVARSEGVYVNAAIGVPFERNEVFLFGPDGRQLWRYRKNHPVPGMEPVAPFNNPVPVVSTPYGRLASLICFDGDFPDLARVEADILLTPSWDWPEVSYAHTMRMVRLRGIENGYSLIRPVFNGTAAAFDPFGRTLAMKETLSGGRHVMIVDLPTRGVPTVYGRAGDLFAWMCVAGLLALTVLGVLHRRRA